LNKPQPYIRCDQVAKSFGPHKAVDSLFLDIAEGEFLSLLGPSGSGKTTLLMMIAGFETPTSGDIWIAGRRVDHLPPHKRNMGVVFQNYALFPHLTVAQNVAFPLEMRGVRGGALRTRVDQALDLVQLGHLRQRRPDQLSGGQQQRVALARALVFEPRVVLMDEPLGALDKRLREQMQLDIRALHRRLGLTIVFVTHDQSEALTMSDRIAVFNAGKIEQVGTPRDIYDHPETRFVAEFIGETNLLEGTVAATNGTAVTVRLSDGKEIRVDRGDARDVAPIGAPVAVSVRPERIHLGEPSAGANALQVKLLDSVYHGDHLRLELLVAQTTGRMIAKASRSDATSAIGSQLTASFAAHDCWIVRK